MKTKRKKQLEVQVVHTTMEKLCEQVMELNILLATLGNDLEGSQQLAARYVASELDKHHKKIIASIEVLEKEYGAKPTPTEEQKLYLGRTEF